MTICDSESLSYFKVRALHADDTFALMIALSLTAYTDLLKHKGGQRLIYFLFTSIDSELKIIRLVEPRKRRICSIDNRVTEHK